MSAKNSKLCVSLFGAFRIEGPGGEDLTPKGSRTKGIVALLACETELSLSRVQLGEMLWSDRSPSQRSSSLRQALSELRRSLHPFADILSVNRKTVSLDADRTTILRSEVTSGGFLDDLGISDQKFTAWREAKREGQTTFPASAQQSARPSLIFHAVNQRPELMRLFEDQFIDLATRSAQETHSIDVYLETPDQISRGSCIVTVQAFHLSHDNVIGIRVVLEAVDGQRVIWSGHTSEPLRPGPVSQSLDHLRLNQQLQSKLAEVFSHLQISDPHDADANLLASIGVRRMFSMRHEDLRIADQLFSKAYEIEERGLFEAWRAQLCAIRFIEQEGADKDELRDRAMAHGARALELEPMNANVLSCVANARLALQGDVTSSLELSRLGTEVNPGNALAWWARSNAQLYAEDYAAAAFSADRAYRLSSATHFQFWCAFQSAVTTALVGNLDEAVSRGQEAKALAPQFRPALRYLVALHSKQDDIEPARQALQSLRELEPEASVDRFLNDPDYPASLLRKTSLGEGLAKLL